MLRNVFVEIVRFCRNVALHLKGAVGEQSRCMAAESVAAVLVVTRRC